ncbi:hypothetical protein FACS1894202_09700 [Clostridia bacterium]|nr:hypothetical protein FACS1894202_09700 [Clostridia bacterium]
MAFKKRVEKLVNPEESEKKEPQIRDELEKGDIPAIIIAAFLTLWPALLVVAALLAGLYWFAVR